MTLSQSALATEIENMVPTLGSSSAILAQAYGDYMKDAIAGATPITAATVDSSAVPAMTAAMTFSQPGTPTSGATVITTGLTAFWGAMVAAPATFFSGATVITPPIFPPLIATLAATLLANATGSASLADSAAALAADIHLATDGIGTATIGTPTAIT